MSKRFAGHLAVDDVSFAVQSGEFFGLLGPSGCGKTTLLRLVAGFELATHGEVLLNGSSLDGRKPYERNVSTVFQNYALFPHLNVRRNVAFGLAKADASRADELMHMLQLDGKADRMPSSLSGGERQRVALARSLAMQPEVLLLDEPLSALDPLLRIEVRAELKALQRRTGITFLFVTHDREEALSMSDRIAVMQRGRVEQIGAPEELYRRPRTKFVAAFVGAVNWISGVGVRPESLVLSRGGSGLAGVVESSTFLGNCLQVAARLPGGGAVVAETPHRSGPWVPGEEVRISWAASDEIAAV